MFIPLCWNTAANTTSQHQPRNALPYLVQVQPHIYPWYQHCHYVLLCHVNIKVELALA